MRWITYEEALEIWPPLPGGEAMHIMTMVSKRVETDEDGERVAVVERKRCQFMDTPEALDLYQKRIAAHDTAGELWRIWACEIDDDGGIVVDGEVVA